MTRYLLSSLLVLCFLPCAEAQRITIDLTENDWGVVRDFEAAWTHDTLHLPPVDIGDIPSNPPTFGWDALPARIEKTVHIPATIEQHFWGDNGNPESVAGDYRGVSWWITTVELDESFGGKRVFLDFRSVHLRAEVYVNTILTGYDIIGHTPFSVDITEAVTTGTNIIAVRITDPIGNFDWNDRQVMHWGEYDIPAAHGFGGITGPVVLRAVDPVHITDIWARNSPAVTEADLVATVTNSLETAIEASFDVTITSWNEPNRVVYEEQSAHRLDPGDNELTFSVSPGDARPWTLDEPNLYVAEITLSTDSGAVDTAGRRFGFRWFDVRMVDGDKRLYLNGERVVLRGGMSWGFWPVNGVFATPDMAERDIHIAKEMGFNYINFHRAIGQPTAIEKADEMGFFTYEEPGGYSCEGADPDQSLWREWRRIKMLRMVKRDRSHPSVIIYNLQNRTPNPITGEDIETMKAAHRLDPTRILTFISGFWREPEPEQPEKLHFLPNDFTEYYTGWYDMHNHSRMRSYRDGFYNAPDDYLRHVDNENEVIFWGEDGNMYSPPRLQKIVEYQRSTSVPPGWQVEKFRYWHDAYDRFLDESGFREWFPDVDAFTRSMGDVTLYYHGRIIENIRATNIHDAYTINGWAAPHVVNQSEVVDLYRNPSGDPSIISHYNQPLYLAVKARDKVMETEKSATVDVYVVNELDVSGPHDLAVTLTAPDGNRTVLAEEQTVVTGGEHYGELLLEGMTVPTGKTAGYYLIEAELRAGNGTVVARGHERLYAISLTNDVDCGGIAVADTTGLVGELLAEEAGCRAAVYDNERYGIDCLVIGAAGPRDYDRDTVMDLAANGATVVVLENIGRVAGYLAGDSYKAIGTPAFFDVGSGSMIAGRHPLLAGLPQAQALNWEYQVFNEQGAGATAIRVSPIETVIAAVTGNDVEPGTAVGVVPFGRGCFILSGLPVMDVLQENSMQAVTAKRFLLNCIGY